MKIAITGAAGLFGHGLVQVLEPSHTVFPLTRADADITKADEVEAAISRVEPDIVIHAAANRDPDPCEADPAQAFLVNVHGTRHVVEAARAAGAAVVFISTDSVFEGSKGAPYLESDLAIPLSVYGRTKLRAEQIVASVPKHWIFRVSLLFGPGKTNFVEKLLEALGRGEQVEAASDQISSATYTLDAARKILEVVEAGRCGLYHLSNLGACSRLELARRAAELAGLDPNQAVGKSMDEMARRAPRSKYAVMEMCALKQQGFALPRPWPEALAEYVRLVSGRRSSTGGFLNPSSR